MSFDGLFEPLAVRNLALRNRFVMPGMQRGMANNGEPGMEMVDNYGRCARGGVGLIISESTAPDHSSADWQPMFCRVSKDTLGGWRRLADAVHEGGAHFLIQLWHPGSIRTVPADSPQALIPSLSPSGLVQKGRSNGRAMTSSELVEVRDAFAVAAERAKAIGADGVEIHACHGYLLDQFLWAETNQRTDDYGGSDIASRARYPIEVTKAIRSAVGSDCAISFRFSQWKEVDYGARICESPIELAQLVRLLREAGVDLFNVSTRRFYRPAWPDSPRTLAGWTKSFSDAAIIAGGSVGLSTDICEDLFDHKDPRPELEETLRRLAAGFANQEFDLVAVGRSLIGDPEWVNKIHDKRYEAIRVYNKNLLGHALEEANLELVEQHRRIVDD